MSQLRYLPIPITLQIPADLGGKPVTELTMRPPTTTDVIVAEQSTTTPYDKDVLLYANLTDTTEEFVKSLPYFDYLQLDKAFELFLLPLSEFLGQHALLLPKRQGEAASENLLTSPFTNCSAG